MPEETGISDSEFQQWIGGIIADDEAAERSFIRAFHDTSEAWPAVVVIDLGKFRPGLTLTLDIDYITVGHGPSVAEIRQAMQRPTAAHRQWFEEQKAIILAAVKPSVTPRNDYGL